jgi:ABC-2 type transport system permease protein
VSAPARPTQTPPRPAAGAATRPDPAAVTRPDPAGAGGLARNLALLAWQVRYEQRAFWRNRRRAMASFAFPLMFLLIFGAITRGATVNGDGNIAYINFYVPGIIAYSVMVIGFTNTAMSIALLRAEGVLKRMRTTPMPWGLYLGGIVLSTVITIVVACALLLAIGVLFYKATVHASAVPGLIVTVAVGTVCFTSLGIAVSRFIPKPDSGMPVLMLIVLPLSFISNVFFPIYKPQVLVEIGKFFPLRRVAEGLGPAFKQTNGAGFVGHDLIVLAVWAIVGCWLMVRTMRALSVKA